MKTIFVFVLVVVFSATSFAQEINYTVLKNIPLKKHSFTILGMKTSEQASKVCRLLMHTHGILYAGFDESKNTGFVISNEKISSYDIANVCGQGSFKTDFYTEKTILFDEFYKQIETKNTTFLYNCYSGNASIDKLINDGRLEKKNKK